MKNQKLLLVAIAAAAGFSMTVVNAQTKETRITEKIGSKATVRTNQ